MSVEALEYIKENLLKQGARSMIGNSCVYMDNDGNKCAVGWLIADDETEAFDVKDTVRILINAYAPRFKYNCSLKYLESAQKIHDEFPVYAWEQQFDKLIEMAKADSVK